MYELIYLDTCKPDYFQGFAGHTYAIPVAKESTGRHVMIALFSDIDSEEIYRPESPLSDSDYESLKDSVRSIFHANPNLDSAWSESLPSYEDDTAESVFAYFGVRKKK